MDATPPLTPEEAEIALLDGLVTGMVSTRAAIAALQSFEVTLMSAAAGIAADQASRMPTQLRRDREMPLRSIAAEVATALRVSDRTVQRQLSDAAALTRDFPLTHAALAEGRISRAHVGVIVEAGTGIRDDDARAGFEAAALDRAAVETAGRLRPIARALAERSQSQSLEERHVAARAERGISVIDLDDGMAQLSAVLPAVLAHGIHDRLTQQAHALAVARDAAGDRGCEDDGDTRTRDELRADIFCDLLLAGRPVEDDWAGRGALGAIRAHVQVTIPVLGLIGAGDGAGERAADLVGYGPIDPDTARVLAGGASSWDRLMTDPVKGSILAVDRYRPNEDQRRLLRARDEHCRFPGCRMPVWRSDIDHTHDAAAGGATRADNLAHLCRRHHSLKHASDWRVRQLARGTLEWTSPTGRVYIDAPTPTLRFMADADPPPF